MRNIKLRTSRKLLFVAGLLMVFSCHANQSLHRNGEDAGTYLLRLQKHLLNFVRATPLNILVWTLRELRLNDICKAFLDDYEQFLSQINDSSVRERLGKLSENDVYTDDTFLGCRDISHRLQVTLRKMCFETDSPLREFIREYGVF